MRCEQFRELISAYIEQSLAPPLAAKMEQHAAGCEACRSELTDVRMLWQAMAEARQVEPPTFLHARIMKEVLANAPVAPAPRWWELAWRPRFAFAAAAVLLVIAIALWSRNAQTNAIALSVISSGNNPVNPIKTTVLPTRFEPFRTESGDLYWMLKMNAASPTAVEITAGERFAWSGVVAQETPVVLPAVPHPSALAVRVAWDGSNVLRAWLPAELNQGEHKPVLVLRQTGVEETLARIAQAYSAPLVLVGEADPLTRVNLESAGVALDEMLQELAKKLNLEVARAEDGTIVLTAR